MTGCEKLDKIAVGLIGATGAVGQRFIQLLDKHPWFNLEVLAASEKSAGDKYSDIVNWKLTEPMPEEIGELSINPISAETLKAEGVKLIFSALPGSIAGDIETDLAANGFFVFSNASAHRMDKAVPLLIADVNPGHLSLIKQQNTAQQGQGYIVTNPNCCVVGLATALKPLVDNFKFSNVNVTTYQALSGAGYPGVSAMDINGNILPYIPDEEDKVESECNKILGDLAAEGIEIEPKPMDVIANCARVPVRDGHLEAVVIDLDESVAVEDVYRAFTNYSSLNDIQPELPSAPKNTIIVTSDENRPQPILDVNSGPPPARARGMAVTIGRIKMYKNKLRFYLLVHNTIRGAAGCSIMNTELAKVEGYL